MPDTKDAGSDFRFTPDQRKRLAQLRVSPKQIEILEGRACLVGRAWLRKSPPCTVVSEKIKALSGHLRAAREILEEIRAAKTPECRVAEGLLGEAVCRSGKEAESLDPTGLEALAHICDDALTMFPKQTRHRDADPRIIRWIFEALIAGHGAEHYILGREAYPRHGDDWPAVDTHPPPFNFKPSSSEGGQFREVVGICYEAMT
ncbi:MAG: hypothetical protein ACREWE_11810, partial [Gammaproteobacteria bacterium]